MTVPSRFRFVPTSHRPQFQDRHPFDRRILWSAVRMDTLRPGILQLQQKYGESRWTTTPLGDRQLPIDGAVIHDSIVVAEGGIFLVTTTGEVLSLSGSDDIATPPGVLTDPCMTG